MVAVATKKEDELAAMDTSELVGEQPDNELQSSRHWLVFQSNNFGQPLVTELTLTNLDPYPVAYCLKARDRTMFLVSEPYGILQAREELKLRLYLKRAEVWSRDVSQLLGKHQIVVENLRLRDGTKAQDQKAGRVLARDIFKRSAEKNPMQRLFWRINVVLKKEEDEEKKK